MITVTGYDIARADISTVNAFFSCPQSTAEARLWQAESLVSTVSHWQDTMVFLVMVDEIRRLNLLLLIDSYAISMENETETMSYFEVSLQGLEKAKASRYNSHGICNIYLALCIEIAAEPLFYQSLRLLHLKRRQHSILVREWR